MTYTAVITNTSTVDALNVDQLTDSIYGNLINGPVKASCTLGGAAVHFRTSSPSERASSALPGDGLGHPDQHTHRLRNRRRGDRVRTPTRRSWSSGHAAADADPTARPPPPPVPTLA